MAVDGELGARLESILSDPQQMEKLTAMAKDLFGPAPDGPKQETPAPAGAAPTAADSQFVAALGRAFAGGGERSRSTALLMAMRPYMKPEKQEKLDRAMQIARMANIAGVVMRQYGDGHGL